MTYNNMSSTFSFSNAALAFGMEADEDRAQIPGFAAGSYMYLNMPAGDYHADRDALSSSMLKPLLVSPAHFQEQFLSAHASSKAMDFGSLVHALVLEPHMVGSEFVIYPGVADGRAAEYKAFVQAHADRMVVDEPTFSFAKTLAEKILYRKVFGRLFGDFVSESQCEASIYFVEPTTGTLMKIRPDVKHPDFTFDLKTSRHADVNAFVRDGLSMDYDLSAFMYSLGRSLFDGTEKPKPFIFIAAESTGPSSINVVTAGSSFLSNGAKKFQEALTVYSACSKTGFWPDAGSECVAEIDPWQTFSAREGWKYELGKTDV